VSDANASESYSYIHVASDSRTKCHCTQHLRIFLLSAHVRWESDSMYKKPRDKNLKSLISETIAKLLCTITRNALAAYIGDYGSIYRRQKYVLMVKQYVSMCCLYV
jgi:hypothetical protein